MLIYVYLLECVLIPEHVSSGVSALIIDTDTPGISYGQKEKKVHTKLVTYYLIFGILEYYNKGVEGRVFMKIHPYQKQLLSQSQSIFMKKNKHKYLITVNNL